MSRRKGDWDCPECSNHNFASRTTCRRCPYKKPTSMVANLKSAAASIFGDPEVRPSWWCRNCRFDIYASKAKCGKCDEARPAQFVDKGLANVVIATYGAKTVHVCTNCAAITTTDHGPKCKGCHLPFTVDRGVTPDATWYTPPLSAEDKLKHDEERKQKLEQEEYERKRKREQEEHEHKRNDELEMLKHEKFKLDEEEKLKQRRRQAEEDETFRAMEHAEHQAFLADRTRQAALRAVDLNADNDVEAEEGENVCSICLLNRIALTFHPCRHACLCRTCYTTSMETGNRLCPICRKHIDGALNILIVYSPMYFTNCLVTSCALDAVLIVCTTYTAPVS
jgi:hypothetical protein